jgi:DNA-binding transcriptional MerR regulator
LEYTIQNLAALAGVSTRPLRYYDQIGLLKPVRIGSSGSRIYGEQDMDRLQQILFFRELDLPLVGIGRIINQPGFDTGQALAEQAHDLGREKLLARRRQLDQLIDTVEKTITCSKGAIKMNPKEKFAGFKREQLAENENKYGREIRQKYGEETVEAANRKFLNLSEEDLKRMQAIEEEMFAALRLVLQSGDLESAAAITVCEKHQAWLGFTWPSYSAQAHASLAEAYMADERFKKYYDDRGGPGAAAALRDAIVKYAR